ncbi:MAG TPA: sigma-54 dependent transcriptional regulator [Lysobacter sp.]
MTDSNATVLIVDDDVEFAQSAADYARSHGFLPTLAHTLEQSRSAMRRDGNRDLLLLDLNLPDGSGFDLIDDLDLADQGHVAIVTGEPDVESASRAKSLPIMDYLVKPLRPLQFDALLAAASARHRTMRALPGVLGELVGECTAMRSLIDEICRIAPTPASVLVVGESGTGKELVARALHERSGRAGPFVPVNCGAITPDLLASHLFGHERGSFTGASARHVGFFEQAHRGTLFLDEITEMPPALQVYLLRALENGSITRVGGTGQIATDVRVIAATNRDPIAAVDSGLLREDLFYRLADFTLALPPLRLRDRDLPMLAQLFVERLNAHYQLHKQLVPGTERVLLQYGWPGNVRELRSAVQRAYLLSDDDWVRVTPTGRSLAATQSVCDAGSIRFSVGMAYADIEREMLLRTLAHFDNDKTRTAEALGVSVRTIHNQLARLNAQPQRPA